MATASRGGPSGKRGRRRSLGKKGKPLLNPETGSWEVPAKGKKVGCKPSTGGGSSGLTRREKSVGVPGY